MLICFLAASTPAVAREDDARTGAEGPGISSPVEPGDTPVPEEPESSVAVEPDDASAPEPSSDVDVMVVRATGRDDFLKDLSVSVTSFSAAEIKALRIQNIADLADYTPNLEINTRSAASNPTLFIRGIGLKDYNANAAGAVAIYQDGVAINSPALQLGQLFDTEELTVLRGPQGSLNGRNATAGAIMIDSVLPDGSFNTSSSFTYGNYNAIQAEGAIGFPIVEELLSGRAAFTANFRDGTTKNNCADWDPESIGMPLLNEETIRAAWVANGMPTTRRDGLGNCIGALGCEFPNIGKPQTDNGLPVEEGGRPLVPDNVCIWADPGSLRFGVPGHEGEPVWVADEFAKTPADFQGLKHHINNVDDWAARGILRFQPRVLDGTDWILNFHGGQNKSDSTHLQSLHTTFNLGAGEPYFTENGNSSQSSEVGAIVNSNHKFEGIREVKGLYTSTSNDADRVPGGRGGDDVDSGFYDLDGKELLDTWGFSLNGVVDTGPILLTSITGYEWYDRSLEDEGDAIPIASFPGEYEDSAWQVSQELRASGDGELYRWFIGGYFLHDELDASNVFPSLRSRRIEQTFAQTLTSGAGYASGRYWLLDEVYFDGGLRYNIEQKEFTLASTIVVLSGSNEAPAIPEQTVSETWTGLTGDATLAWEPTGDWMYDARLDKLNLYVKYGRGMKGGHFNAGLTIQSNAFQQQRIETVEPEFIHAVEVGFKSRWLEDRVILNVALFRYWYQDLQVFDFSNEKGELPIQKLLNSDASVLGAELELQARPLPGLLIQFGGGWLDSEFLDFKVAKAVNRPRGQAALVEFDYSGHPLIAAPEWNFSSIVEYQIPLGRWGSVVPQYTVSFRSKVYLDPQMLDPISQEAHWQHNARLAYRTPDGRFELAGWVENIMDDRYRIDAFDLSLDNDAIIEVWNDPRTFGFTLSAYF
jgi:outer membrane receptor protein involved in Fe transport